MANDSVILRKYLGWCPNAQPYPASQRAGSGAIAIATGSPGDIAHGGATGWIGRNGQVAVAITTGLCLMALTAVLKNLLYVPADILNRDIILYIIIYGGFITASTPVKRQACPGQPARWPLFWCIVIVITTLAIMAVYAL
ncbi:MAG: hypothetical protein A4E35_01513 [Methanoregula sp. PtaU1.Bin051]|nr:MAG: hypothetical protein A4E35_01513 [Methanoregula sp. PtaU1.Bin051]